MTPETKAVRLRQMKDEQLMEQFQQGIELAFNIIVERYTKRLTYYLYPYVKDDKEVEDLLQETWLRLYRNRHAYRRIAKFSTWLYTIAGNLARSEHRRRLRQRKVNLHSRHTTNRAGQEYEEEGLSYLPTPYKELEDNTSREEVLRALGTLTDEFREVVVLRDLQQLRYIDIAEITGLPLGTVKSRINRGRGQIRSYLTHLR